MSVNTVSSPAGIAALRAYQQVKQHGEPAPSKSDLASQLNAEQELSSGVSTPVSNETVPQLSTQEQIQQQQELERSWGLMSAILGTQFDEYA